MAAALSVNGTALDALIRRRAGVLRVAELGRCGGSAYVRTTSRTGWRRVLPGVVLATGRPPTRRDRRLAALRYAGAGAVLTGLTALRLHGFRRLPTEWDVVVLVPRKRARSSASYVRIERTGRLPPHQWRDGLPCAPVARALVDAARRMRDPDAVTALFGQAIGRGLCSMAGLAAELRAADGRGLRMARERFVELRARALAGARAELDRLLDLAGVADDPEVAVHLDTSAWELTTEAALRARVECRRLAKIRTRVVRVTPDQLARSPASVLVEIRTAVPP